MRCELIPQGNECAQPVIVQHKSPPEQNAKYDGKQDFERSLSGVPVLPPKAGHQRRTAFSNSGGITSARALTPARSAGARRLTASAEPPTTSAASAPRSV